MIELGTVHSPTVSDTIMKVVVKLGGKPILLYDPKTINKLVKYFKNLANQDQIEIYQYIFDLNKSKREELEQQKIKER